MKEINNKQLLINDINTLRKDNKNKWYMQKYIYNNKLIEIKGYNTWLQVFKIHGIRQNTVADISVKEFLNTLNHCIKE